MKNGTQFFTKDRQFYRSFFVLTAMMALQNVVTCSVNLADNIMLGGYSEEALSGVALANQIQFILQMLTMGIGEGLIVLGAQYWGKKDITAIKKVINIGLLFGCILGAVLWAVIFFFPEQCLFLFTPEKAVIAEGVSYIRIVCFTYLFFCLTNILLCSLRSVETVRIGLLVSLSTLCINMCLNYCLIYGNFGFPRLGAAGATVATLVSRVVEFLIMCVYILGVDKKIRYRLRDLRLFDRMMLKDFTKVDTPVFISNGLWGFAMAAQAAILGHLGQAAIAANSMAATVFQITSVVAYGAASASAVMIGKAVGAGREHMLKEYTRTLQVLYLGIGFFTGLILFLLRDPIVLLFSVSDEAKELAKQFMAVLSITVVGTSYQVACLTGIVRGGGDTRFVLYNDTIFMWGLVLPLSALAAFVFHWSSVTVFFCLKCDQLLKCIVAVVKVNSYNWVRKLTRDKIEEPAVS